MIAPRRTAASVRGFARWLPRSGGAVLASVAVHAAAAVTVGGVLAVSARSGEHQPQMVELDLAPALDIAANLPLPAPAPPVMAPAEPVRAHPSPRRRVAIHPTPVPALAVASPPVPVIATEASDEAPRFAMSAGTVASRPAAPAALAPIAGAGAAPSGVSASSSGDSAFGEGDVNVPARLLAPSALVYPAAARAAEIEVDFPVEIVVDVAGRVIAARALQRAGYGLDEAALRAIRAYHFSPAMRAGHAVSVRMRWTVQFRLR